MPKAKKPRELPDVVAHPRYGSAVVPSGSSVSEAEIRASFWGYRDAVLYPESAIAADPEHQNFTVMPRRFYVDVLKTCRDCERQFLFFAREQKHWFETLGFWIDADCVRCPACRRSERGLRTRFKRYGELVGRDDLSEEEVAELATATATIWDAALLRDEQKLRHVHNVVQRRISHRKEAKMLARCVEALTTS